MPSAHDYEQIASKLEWVAEDLDGVLNSVKGHAAAKPMVGDFATQLCTTAVTACEDLQSSSSGQLRDAAAEARSRAAVCRQYEAAVRAYYKSEDPNRQWPTGYPSWATQ